MSFRKRSVRPNLNLSKRSTPGTSGQKVENEGGADNLPALQDNNLLAQEPITASNVASKPDMLPLETKEQSQTPGKPLSKRTKVAPKVGQRKTGIGVVTCSPPCSLSLSTIVSQTRSTPHSQEMNDNTTLSPVLPCNITEKTSPIQSCVDSTNINKETFSEQPVNINTDVIMAYNLISKGGNISEINREIDKNKSCPAGGNDNVHSSGDTPGTEVVKGNRLSKRTRVMPKLTPKSLNKENKDNVSKDVDSNVNLPSDVLSTGCPRLSGDNDNVLKDDVTKCNETIPRTSCLQKRVKVRPKLKSRVNVTCTSPTDKKELERNENLEDENVNINESKKISEEDKCLNDTVITSTEETVPMLLQSISNECDRAINLTPLELGGNLCNVSINDTEYNRTENNTINEQLLSVNNYFTSCNLDRSISDDILMDKKELKHVRFTSGDSNDHDIYNDYNNQNNDTNLSEIDNMRFPITCESENISLKVPNPTESLNERYDSNDDYDSMSEGEMLGKQLESKNKVFKPNLGGKRRERLSSFSAYSSCDEEDWQNPKRKKDKIKKKPEEEEKEKEHNKKEEKKKKPKPPTKPKKDRENLEPNAGKVEKKRKKKEKPVVNKLPKHEEREVSSLTMQELIHYSNPSFKTVELRSKREEDENEHVVDLGSVVPPASDEQKPNVDKTPDDDGEVMAPQIMINEDGEIVINQESLTISKTVDDSILKKSAVVYEDALSYGTHLKRKHNIGKRWKIDETLRFYKALSEIGTDFTLMSQAFGRFSRNELKKKFKKEEKVNCDLVDRALSNRLPLNMEMFLRGKEELNDPDENESGEAIVPNIIENSEQRTNVECDGGS